MLLEVAWTDEEAFQMPLAAWRYFVRSKGLGAASFATR